MSFYAKENSNSLDCWCSAVGRVLTQHSWWPGYCPLYDMRPGMLVNFNNPRICIVKAEDHNMVRLRPLWHTIDLNKQRNKKYQTKREMLVVVAHPLNISSWFFCEFKASLVFTVTFKLSRTTSFDLSKIYHLQKIWPSKIFECQPKFTSVKFDVWL